MAKIVHADTRRPGELKTYWVKVIGFLLESAVESDDSQAVRAVLSATFETPEVKSSVGEPPVNSSCLIRACLKGELIMTKLLIQHGFRLHSVWFDNPPKEILLENLPFKIRHGSPYVSARDEILNLHILKAMSQPAYILSRFMAVRSTITFGSSEKEDEDCIICIQCSRKQRASEPELTPFIGEEMPHCPSFYKFKPADGCLDHQECNDPFLKCFKITEVAKRCAEALPEYRDQYLAISESCSELATSLLDTCRDTQEVQLLLEDDNGSANYFKVEIAKKMPYPRLQIAMQNQHKEFVSHMFCQQILRDQWHGNVPWKHKPRRFKILYCIVQCLMTFPHILHWFIRMIIQDFNITQEKWKFSKRSYDFFSGDCNLDQPLNRFISFTGLYLLYLLLIVMCILTPITDYDQSLNNYHWYHDCLLIFTVAMVVQDVLILTSVRSWLRVISFWMIYDIIMHLLLVMAFSAR